MRSDHLADVLLGVAPLLVSCLMVACNDDTVHVQGITNPPPNSPPSIVTQGPEIPSTGFEVTQENRDVHLYVLVADPNGLQDISAVVLGVDSVVVRRLIVRRDTLVITCGQPLYAENDTVDLSRFIPRVFPGNKFAPMERSGGAGIFVSPPLGGYYEPRFPSFPRFDAVSALIGPPSRRCTDGAGDHVVKLSVRPPAAADTQDVYITYLDLEYAGVSVTVFDAAGAFTSTSFPNIRAIYTSREEKSAAP